jgi:hypothetical protein
MNLLPGYVGSARFSDDRKHRLWLSRMRQGCDRPIVLWCGMNPSQAGSDCDDMTVRKEIGFGERRFGIHHYVKVNVATLIATKPSDITGMPLRTIRCEDNLPLIRIVAASADTVVMATGNLWEEMRPAFDETLSILRAIGKDIFCLGRTGSGWPKHPSRISYGTAFEDYS